MIFSLLEGTMKQSSTLPGVVDSLQKNPSTEVLYTPEGQRFSSFKLGNSYVFVMKTAWKKPRMYIWVPGDTKGVRNILSGLIERQLGFY